MRFNFLSVLFLLFISLRPLGFAQDTLSEKNTLSRETALIDTLGNFMRDTMRATEPETPHEVDFRRSYGKITPFYLDPAFIKNNDSIFIPRDSKLSRGFAPWHKGLDVVLHMGDTLYAAWKGTVHFAGADMGGYGNLVIIDHPNGLQTYYGHQSKVLVYAGEIVKAGQPIGLGGSTGFSTGPHLHFETRYDGIPFDPQDAITRSGSSYVYEYLNPNSKLGSSGSRFLWRYQSLFKSHGRHKGRASLRLYNSSRTKGKKAATLYSSGRTKSAPKKAAKVPVKTSTTKRQPVKKRAH